MGLALYIVVGVVVGLVAGGGGAYFLLSAQLSKKDEDLDKERKKLKDELSEQKKQLRKQAVLEAKEELAEERRAFEQDMKKERNEIQKLENRFLQKEENLDNKIASVERREQDAERKIRDLDKKSADLDRKSEELAELKSQQETALERVSGLSREEAKAELVKAMEEDARRDAARLTKRIMDEAQANAEEKAKYVVGNAIQRIASDYVAETTVSVVDLPGDEMKGRIIGREGRNIRALEAATGIDLIIDDTPECVILSGYDAVKRTIAGMSLKRLIQDGRIHPARIEETVNKVRKEISKTIREAGKQAAYEVGIHGLHDEVINMMGRLNYRTSYSQNVLRHSVEVSNISGMIASELGANTKIAKRAGLLHDIGKAMDQEIEGPHAVIGAEFCRKHGESQEVVHAIGAHHFDWEPNTLEAVIVLTADALSAARPGARREVIQNYINRMENLEAIANQFNGVEKSYAIQAGRELRIIVEPKNVSDDEMQLIAREIAAKIESEMDYPGEIKVTLIRETRTVDYAR